MKIILYIRCYRSDPYPVKKAPDLDPHLWIVNIGNVFLKNLGPAHFSFLTEYIVSLCYIYGKKYTVDKRTIQILTLYSKYEAW